MVAQFSDDAVVKQMFEDHTGDLASMLAEEGLISDSHQSIPVNAAEQPTKVGIVEENGEPVTHLQTRLEVSDGLITVAVHAETGRAYALYRPKSKDRVFLIDPDLNDQVDTEGCWTDGSECRYASCDGWENAFVSGSEYEKTCCGSTDSCSWSNTGNCCDPA